MLLIYIYISRLCFLRALREKQELEKAKKFIATSASELYSQLGTTSRQTRAGVKLTTSLIVLEMRKLMPLSLISE